jgi:hypothetical protein
MADGMYEVLALLPESSDFTLDTAVTHFRKIRRGQGTLQAELATSEEKQSPSGFRVFFGDWAIVAWLESGEEVRAESQNDTEYHARKGDLPGPAEVIAACSRRLTVWSDEDEGGDYTDDFIEFADELRERFGAFIQDPVNGGWWK